MSTADRGTEGMNASTPRDLSQATVGELMGNISRDLSTLMRQELELAKTELKQEAITVSRGAGLLGAGGFAGYMVLLFLSIAAWWGLGNVMDAGLAALLVAVVWAVVGAILAVVGRKKMRQVKPAPKQTMETLKDVPGALAGR
jgi:hypothetical protein